MKVKNSAVNINEKAKEEKKVTVTDISVAVGLTYQFVTCETGCVLNTNDNSWKHSSMLSVIY